MTKPGAQNVEWRLTSSLIPYANNARTHSDAQVAQIAASIKEFGFNNPVLVDGESGIIAGHGRLMAARQLGMDRVPVIELKHLSEAQRKAYILADNKLALNAGWDNDLLAGELERLKELDFDLSLTGFDDFEIAGLLDKTEGLTDPDEVPAVQERVVTEPGDRWMLGKHRLKCGDSTSADDVASLLAGVEPHLMVTDPPYGVNYDPGWRDGALDSWAKPRASGVVHNDDRADWREAWSLFPGDVAYVWHGALHATVVAESLVESGFAIRSQIIWTKQSLVVGRGDYHWMHEPCWYAVRKNRKGHYCGGRKQTTVWEIKNNSAMAGGGEKATGHGTQKPVECMRRPIVNNSSPGQAVYDPFLGSGTTLIAGEMEGRHVYGMELPPQYCDVIIRRWQEFTGQKAVLDEAAASWSFDEVAANRMPSAA